jgi:hypothetical protein
MFDAEKLICEVEKIRHCTVSLWKLQQSKIQNQVRHSFPGFDNTNYCAMKLW